MLYREFEFFTNSGSFIPLLQQMLHFIEVSAESDPSEKEQLLFCSKTILIEFLTNAIKHSGASRTLLRIDVNDGGVLLTKTDWGKPLQLLRNDHLALTGNKLVISSDSIHTLHATAVGPGLFQFTCTENNPDGLPDLANLSEHFGLLMIAKAAQQFFYQYWADAGLNVFRASLLFGK